MGSRGLVRCAVVLTALLCLGTAGYAGQIWWAKRVARRLVEDGVPICHYVSTSIESPVFVPGGIQSDHNSWVALFSEKDHDVLVQAWKQCPWWGTFGRGSPYWIPRRSCYEALLLMTGEHLSDAPEAWEAWFKSHPDLAWDGKRKRLVEPR